MRFSEYLLSYDYSSVSAKAFRATRNSSSAGLFTNNRLSKTGLEQGYSQKTSVGGCILIQVRFFDISASIEPGGGLEAEIQRLPRVPHKFRLSQQSQLETSQGNRERSIL